MGDVVDVGVSSTTGVSIKALSAVGEEGRSIGGETMIVEGADCSGEGAESGSGRETLLRVVLEGCSGSLSTAMLSTVATCA